MTDVKLSKEARTRISTMIHTNNGFEIAETDLKLRGLCDLMGTQQSGVLDLKLADLAKDGSIVQLARQAAMDLLDTDEHLENTEHLALKQELAQLQASQADWSIIS